jgi:hypothetical protein
MRLFEEQWIIKDVNRFFAAFTADTSRFMFLALTLAQNASQGWGRASRIRECALKQRQLGGQLVRDLVVLLLLKVGRAEVQRLAYALDQLQAGRRDCGRHDLISRWMLGWGSFFQTNRERLDLLTQRLFFVEEHLDLRA